MPDSPTPQTSTLYDPNEGADTPPASVKRPTTRKPRDAKTAAGIEADPTNVVKLRPPTELPEDVEAWIVKLHEPKATYARAAAVALNGGPEAERPDRPWADKVDRKLASLMKAATDKS